MSGGCGLKVVGGWNCLWFLETCILSQEEKDVFFKASVVVAVAFSPTTSSLHRKHGFS
jgi:hypothetical protein